MPGVNTAVWELVEEEDWNKKYNKLRKEKNLDVRPYNFNGVTVDKESGDMVYSLWPYDFRIKYRKDERGTFVWNGATYEVLFYIRQYSR